MNKLSITRTLSVFVLLSLFVFVLFSIMLALSLGSCEKEEEEKKVNPLTADVQIGDEVGFGVFSERPIVWRVLAIQDESALLTIAHDIGDETNMPTQYNDKREGDVSWEDCSLRKWLNEDFLTSFSESEQDRILTTELSDGSGIKDKVFIFSRKEAQMYLPDDESRMLPYTRKDGEEDTTAWWLRSPEAVGPSWVNKYGLIFKFYNVVNSGYTVSSSYEWKSAVRPAMWVSLDGLESLIVK